MSSSSRRVRFSPKMRVAYVPSLSEMDSSTIASCHYSESDFESMQHDTVRTIRAMRAAGGPLNEHEQDEAQQMTARGLEAFQSRAAVELKKKNRRNVTDAVLDEQDRQWNCGRDDDEQIASASRAFSKIAVKDALDLAASDAAFVRSEVQQQLASTSGSRRTKAQSVLKRAQDVIAANLASEAKAETTMKTTTTKHAAIARRHSVATDMALLGQRTMNNNDKVLTVRSASIPGTFQEENDLTKGREQWNISSFSQQRQQQQQGQQRTTLRSMLTRR